MMGTGYGVGTPTSYFGHTLPTMFPYGGQTSPGLQAQQYLQPLQQQQILQQLLQLIPQQLQQLLQIVPHQLQHVQSLQQQQLHHLQQLLQIVPQQLHQLQQVVQSLPGQQPFSSGYQPFGTIQTSGLGAFGGGSAQSGAPWGFSGAGQGGQSITSQIPGLQPHAFGFGAQPGQVM